MAKCLNMILLQDITHERISNMTEDVKEYGHQSDPHPVFTRECDERLDEVMAQTRHLQQALERTEKDLDASINKLTIAVNNLRLQLVELI